MIKSENLISNTKTNKWIGEYCKKFRLEELGLTLSEVCRENNINYKSFWSFEHGDADGIKYIYAYINCCNNNGLVNKFLSGLFKGVD